MGQVDLVCSPRERYIPDGIRVISGRLEKKFTFENAGGEFAQKRAAKALWLYSWLTEKKLPAKRNIKVKEETKPTEVDGVNASGVETGQVSQEVLAVPGNVHFPNGSNTGWVELEDRSMVSSRRGMSLLISLVTEKG